MWWLAVVGAWLSVIVGGGLILARLMAFGDRPSAPELAAGLDAGGRPVQARQRSHPAPVLSLR